MAWRRQVARRLGGKTRLPGDVAADDAQGPDERDPERAGEHARSAGTSRLAARVLRVIRASRYHPDVTEGRIGAGFKRERDGTAPSGLITRVGSFPISSQELGVTRHRDGGALVRAGRQRHAPGEDADASDHTLAMWHHRREAMVKSSGKFLRPARGLPCALPASAR